MRHPIASASSTSSRQGQHLGAKQGGSRFTGGRALPTPVTKDDPAAGAHEMGDGPQGGHGAAPGVGRPDAEHAIGWRRPAGRVIFEEADSAGQAALGRSLPSSLDGPRIAVDTDAGGRWLTI